jgi:hypothetical protein
LVVRITDENDSNDESYEIQVSKIEKHNFVKFKEIDVDLIMKSFLFEILKALEEQCFEKYLEHPDWESSKKQFKVFFVTNSNEEECSKLQEILIDRTIKLTKKKADGLCNEARRSIDMVDIPHLTMTFRNIN